MSTAGNIFGMGGASIIDLVNRVRTANPYYVGNSARDGGGGSTVTPSFQAGGGSFSLASAPVVLDNDKAVNNAIAQLKKDNAILDEKLKQTAIEKNKIIAAGVAATKKTKIELDKSIIDFSKIKGKIAVQLGTIDNQGFIIGQLRREIEGYIFANKKVLRETRDLIDKRDIATRAANDELKQQNKSAADAALKAAEAVQAKINKQAKENSVLLGKAAQAEKVKTQQEKELEKQKATIQTLINAKNILTGRIKNIELEKAKERGDFKILIIETDNNLRDQTEIINIQKTKIGELQETLTSLTTAPPTPSAPVIIDDFPIILPPLPETIVIKETPWKNVIPWAVIIGTIAASQL